MLLALALISPAAALAQQVSPDSARTKASNDSAKPDLTEDTIVLSPFEVTTSKNAGYSAYDTLAGSRVRTELKDVGSSISVVTEQFLQDTGAVDNQSLLKFLTNAEVGGTGGNFAGMGDSRTLDDTSSRTSPNSNTRIRGLTAADNTRGFFLTSIPWDSYNTTRIDVQRGANSILFGNGSPAGIINGDPDGANLQKDSTTVNARLGNYGSNRVSINTNVVLKKGELAVRFAALHDRKEFRQRPAYDQNNRVYGAVRYDPKFLKFKNAHTSIKFNIEKGDNNANRPRSTTPIDCVSPWFLTTAYDMKTPEGTYLGTVSPMKSHDGYNPFLTGLTDSAIIAANPTNRSIGAMEVGNANTEYWFQPAGNNGINSVWFGGLGVIYDNASSSTASDMYATGFGYYGARSTTGALEAASSATIAGLRGTDIKSIANFADYAGSVPTYQSVGMTTAATGFLYQLQGVYKAKTLTDSSFFDFYNKLLDGPNKHENANFSAWNATIDQSFFKDRLAFSVAYDRQLYTTDRLDYLGGSPVLAIDVYRYLPYAKLDNTGNYSYVLNPNFGKVFVLGSPSSNSRGRSTRDSWRVTGFADLNIRDFVSKRNLLTKFIGNHKITGVVEGNSYKSETAGYARYSLSDASAASIFGINTSQVTANARKVLTVNYLSDNIAAASSMSGANVSGITATRTVTGGDAMYFNATWTGAASGATSYGSVWAGGTNSDLNLVSSVTTANKFQSENPYNYAGWKQRTAVDVLNADTGDIGELTTSRQATRNDLQSWAIVDQWYSFNRKLIILGGLRQDTIKPYTSINQATDVNGTADVDVKLTPQRTAWVYPKKLLKTYSFVGHSPEALNKHLPWDINLTGFYNRSENFQPAYRVGILGDPLDVANGRTKDYGFTISGFKNRVSLKVAWFQTNVKGANLDGPVGSLTWRIGDGVANTLRYAYTVKRVQEGAVISGYNYKNSADATDTRIYPYQPKTGSSATWTTADWQQAYTDANNYANAALEFMNNHSEFMSAWSVYTKTPTDASTSGYITPANLAITGDTRSSGTEYELNLRPVNNWNITMNASKTHATRFNLAGSVSTFMEELWAAMQGNAGLVRWYGGSQGNATTNSSMARIGRNAWAYYAAFKAQEGNNVAELRPWRFNVTNTYNFTKGKLKGYFVGGSYRWQDRNVIGYGVSEKTAFNANAQTNPAIGYLDPSKPFYGPTEDAIDLWCGYSKKIFKNIDWRIQFNLRNAFDRVHLVPISTNPDGSTAAWRIADGTSWELSNTFKF